MPNPALIDNLAGLTEIEEGYIAKSLLRQVPYVSPYQTCAEVLTLLNTHSDVIGLPVVEDQRPMGLINRNLFMEEMAKPFRLDLFSRKSCIAFMDKDPLVVDADLSIQSLSFKAVESGGKTLKDGFIIIGAEQLYLGVGLGEDLVRMIAHLQAEKNRLLLESINYASVIQKSFLRSSQEDIAIALQNYFIHWEPRDKVGGDYYFGKRFADGLFLALIDCTGHGVPGAFMTLIMAAFLDHILRDDNRLDPAAALAVMNCKVKTALGQIHNPSEGSAKFANINTGEQSDDGMDCAFCWINLAEGHMTYAGAKTPLFLVHPAATEVEVIEGDKKGVGYVDTPMDYVWSNQTIALAPGVGVYITTDGIIDQIGGPKNIAFGKKRFSQVLLDHCSKSMAAQKDEILRAFYAYQGKQRRRDDVSMLGFRL